MIVFLLFPPQHQVAVVVASGAGLISTGSGGHGQSEVPPSVFDAKVVVFLNKFEDILFLDFFSSSR